MTLSRSLKNLGGQLRGLLRERLWLQVLVGIPAAGIAIILGVDRPLDMLRTVVNVTGDMVACQVAARIVRP